ncbi:calmodulin-binding receptor kinase CaMRLK [Rhodamnia argentea]|uniref:Calmodulin-binding receptor kinase CaMRLK n=1 Tax=Rhodamnia argentea TaxID=178133 RepID=A0A8B8QQ75_9MYRT|nr:calmodulin-binding receptor kinase CaMRLK [Rhodamnia argentea]
MIGKSRFLGPCLIALTWWLVLVDSACNTTTTADDRDLVSRAFASVSGFDPSWLRSSPNSTCSLSLAEIRLPSRNLSGIVAWKHLKAALKGLRAIDLSDNSLQGSVPGWFISSATGLVELNLSSNRFGGGIAFDAGNPRNVSSSSLRVLDLSRNRFTNLGNFSRFFSRLRVLDLSGNDLRAFPLGLSELAALERLDVSGCNISGDPRPVSSLKSLNYLDISNNSLTGVFPNDFPPLAGLAFLNISLNHFAGRVGPETRRKFGDSAFLRAGKNLVLETDAPKPPSPATRSRNSTSPAREPIKKRAASRRPESRKRQLVLILAPITASLVAAAFAALSCVYLRRRRTFARRKKKWAISGPARPEFRMERASGPFSFETESGTAWVADIKEPSSAAVVMFEKPLMSLTFRDLIAATSGFGRESLLGEGRCGPVYRAVLPGDLHVAIRVLEGARAVDHGDAARVFEGLAKLKHPNLLPISGYCIAGKEKLVLYEFMPNGDLRQWLHELPAGAPDVEDWSTDTWEHPGGEPSSPEKANWLTRHRVAVGVARGLAYLHHAGSAHGHLVASNVLLADDLEPRISDFGIQDFGCGKEQFGDGRVERAGPAPERDVYFFGMVLVELLTGREGSEESLAWARRLVREGRGEEALERRLRIGGGAVSEMVECLRVGYLCTAESPGKRPTMQQVVGLLKDIRPQPS